MNTMTSRARTLLDGYQKFSFATKAQALVAKEILEKKYPTMICKPTDSGNLFCKTYNELPISRQVEADIITLGGVIQTK